MSGAAITYLVERMIESGHLRRESDPADRRKVILRYATHGIEVGRAFFTLLADHTHRAPADLPDEDLQAAHRVFTAVLAAMGGFRPTCRHPWLVAPCSTPSPWRTTDRCAGWWFRCDPAT